MNTLVAGIRRTATPVHEPTLEIDLSAVAAQLTETEAKELTSSAPRVYDALGCRGFARLTSS